MLNETRQPNRTLFLSLLLAAAAVAAYWPVQNNRFINCDDPAYVADNPVVQSKLTAAGVTWAFTSTHVANYHPLTWLSHMLDCQLFGLSPRGHHLVSLQFHVLNSVLLFLLLQRLTKRVWPSMFVAGVFALHPLHVESVAWVSERKDVLSGMFWILALWAYARYVERPGVKRYLLVCAMFAMGLLSKPMVVTLPCVLLLLDFWPLRRTRWVASSEVQTQSIRFLILEKAPLLAMTVASCVVTFVAQRTGGAMEANDRVPLVERAANALVSYARYTAKFVWPTHLAAFYPRQAWPLMTVAIATTIIIALTVGFLRFAGRRPYLPVGWLWFLGTLVPVIGVLQVGSQAMADRYMYLPMIGLIVMLVWWLDDVLPVRLRTQAATAGAGILIALGIGTFITCGYWKDTESVFARALRVTPDNAFSRQNLASAQAMKGRIDEAIGNYRRAVELQPDVADVHAGLGYALRLGKRYDEAARELLIARRIAPDDPRIYTQLGHLADDQGKTADAVKWFDRALEVDPNHLDARFNLAVIFYNTGDRAAAAEQLRRAIAIDSTRAQAHLLYGTILLEQGDSRSAVGELAQAVRLNPSDGRSHLKLGLALIACGQSDTGIGFLLNAVQLQPNSPETLQSLAWVLATHPNQALRNGSQAVFLAERAQEITQSNSPEALDALAAALAEQGEFDKAAQMAEKAVALAKQSGKTAMARQMTSRAQQYHDRHAYRDTALSGADSREIMP